MPDVQGVLLVLKSGRGLRLTVLHPDMGPRQVLTSLLGVDVRAVWYMFVSGGLDLRQMVHFSRGFQAGSDVQIMGARV